MSQETEWADQTPALKQPAVTSSLPSHHTESAQANLAAEWSVGETILDLYEVKGVLGEGGMGKVYRVHHKNWNLDLAVKTPRPEIIGKAGAKENFVREAETWVNLGLHPHTVSCYYIRDLGGIPRVFAECVEGGSLSDWIRTGKLYEGGPEEALKRILDIAIQFAWGLHYAHEQGLVHQDVKPANVMMTSEGVAKVTDFGLAQARVLAGEEEQTDTPGKSVVVAGAGLMTPAYASPEQAAGEPLTRKTDIWSWGLSVVEMFTGELTWISGQMASKVLEEYLDSGIEEINVPQMPAPVSDLLRLCFRENPGERPQDMTRVADTLQRTYKETTGVSYSRDLPKAVKALAHNLNNRAVSLMDLGKHEEALSLWDEALRVESHHPEATYNRGLTLWREGQIRDDGLIQEMEEVRKSHENSWISIYLLALVHLERSDSEAAIKTLESFQGINANKEELKAALTIAEGRTPYSKQLEHHGSGGVYSVSLSADGKYALSGGGDNTLKLWEIATGRCLRTFIGHTRGQVRSISLRADGKYALSGGYERVKLWEVATGRCLRTFESSGGVNSVSLSADGNYALSGNGDGTLKLWRIQSDMSTRLRLRLVK